MSKTDMHTTETTAPGTPDPAFEFRHEDNPYHLDGACCDMATHTPIDQSHGFIYKEHNGRAIADLRDTLAGRETVYARSRPLSRFIEDGKHEVLFIGEQDGIRNHWILKTADGMIFDAAQHEPMPFEQYGERSVEIAVRFKNVVRYKEKPFVPPYEAEDFSVRDHDPKRRCHLLPFVSQRDYTDCGVCCVAMALSIPYKKADKIVRHGNDGTRVPALAAALGRRWISHNRHPLPLAEVMKDGRNEVILTKYDHEWGHWIVKDATGHIYDPCEKDVTTIGKYDRADCIVTYQIEFDLPVDPKSVVTGKSRQ